jgi:DNA-binding NarL/FixJ family response regulator
MTPVTDTPPADAEPITLLVCDDHRVLTDALALIVARDPGIDMVNAPVPNAEEAVRIVSETNPAVVLMDVELAGEMNGIEATRRIREISPETNVVVMTGHDDERLLVEVVEAGASGFISKSEGVAQVLDAVKAAAVGETLIDPIVLSRVLRLVASEREARREAEVVLAQLTAREREILQLLAEGLRNDDIAKRLFISPQTVQTHVRNILAKLHVHSKLEAVAFAVKNGAVTV